MKAAIEQEIIELFLRKIEYYEKSLFAHRLAGLDTQYTDADFTYYNNTKFFNERYIETHYNASLMRAVMVSVGWAILPMFILVLRSFHDDFLSEDSYFMSMEFVDDSLFLYLGGNLMALLYASLPILLPSIWLWATFTPYSHSRFSQGMKATPVRYNRQAQLVHLLYKGKEISVHWKDVVAFDYYVPANHFELHRLIFIFPGQPTVLGNAKPIVYQAQFAMGERLSAELTMSRWESIRCFMEQGLDAIQTNQAKRELKTWQILDSDLEKNQGVLLSIWEYVSLAFISTFISDYRQRQFQWNEEIQALSALNAREKGLLDQYDTRPVIATKTAKIGRHYH